MLIYLPIFFFIIDMITGFLINTFGSSFGISSSYKIIFLVLLVISALSKKGEEVNKYLIVIVLFIPIYLLPLVFMGYESIVVYKLSELVKLFTLFIVIYSLWANKDLYKNSKAINYFFIITLILFSINILVGLLGFGFSTYDGFGYKGFIYAGNSLSGMIVLLSTHFLINNGHFKKIYIYLYFLVLACLIGTKSGIIGVTLVYFLVILYGSFIKNIGKVAILLAVFCIILLTNIELIYSTELFQRLDYIYNNFGIVGVILSGRNELFNNLAEHYWSGDLSTIIYGINSINSPEITSFTVEMDFIDLLFSFGLLGGILYMILFVKLIKFVYRRTYGLYKKEFVISSLVLLMISIIAGHVLFNGAFIPYWSVYIGILLIKSNKKVLNENCHHINTISV